MKLVYQQETGLDLTPPVFLICVFRDEALLLEYFMDYYRALGITHFIMIDNLSEDGGPEFLKSIPDINIDIYRAQESYRDADYGVAWINELLQTQCRDQYCLVVDADELLAYDTKKYASFENLIESMEAENANVLATNLVDMYPREIGEPYPRGTDFREHSPYFDAWSPEHYKQLHPIYGSFFHKVGGMRERVFGTRVCIHNFPFFRYDFHPLALAPGRHYFQHDRQILKSSKAIRLHSAPAVLLHFKFLKPDFRKFVEGRIQNNQDWDDSSEYRAYLQSLDNGEAQRLYDPAYSRRLICTDDLDPFFKSPAQSCEASSQIPEVS